MSINDQILEQRGFNPAAPKIEKAPLPKKTIIQKLLGQPQMLTTVKHNGVIYNRGDVLAKSSIAEYMIKNGFAK